MSHQILKVIQFSSDKIFDLAMTSSAAAIFCRTRCEDVRRRNLLRYWFPFVLGLGKFLIASD